jgi:hypothetical protein
MLLLTLGKKGAELSLLRSLPDLDLQLISLDLFHLILKLLEGFQNEK